MSSDLSLPRSRASTLTIEDIIDAKSNGLHIELAPFGLEHIYDYEPGGHHPVHLGDVYGSGERYRVIHKLGHGGFASVWLCRDTEAKEKAKYVVLKILMADTSGDNCPELRVNQLKATNNQHPSEDDGAESICLPLDHFEIHGPNGNHLSLVYPVLGPNVSLGLFDASADPDKDLRDLSLQVTKAVKFLHSQEICHGDLTPSNVLHRIRGLDGLSEDEILQILGSPVMNPVLNASGECHNDPTAPKYLVYPVSWWDVDTRFITKETCLIDFGESFEISQPPNDLGIPGSYRSPEVIFDKQAGFCSDIWALGCSLFEIRTGRKLFNPFDDEENKYLIAVVQVLGKLPEPWWSTTWGDRRRMYKDEADEQGRAISVLESEPGKEIPREKVSGVTSTVHPSVAVNPRSLQDKLTPGLWYMPDHYPGRDRHRDICKTEQVIFGDLLGRLLEYKPEDRISAEEAMNHEWFKL